MIPPNFHLVSFWVSEAVRRPTHPLTCCCQDLPVDAATVCRYAVIASSQVYWRRVAAALFPCFFARRSRCIPS
jgi:hypothetical protein